MQWFNRYSIKSRLIASFLVLFASAGHGGRCGIGSTMHAARWRQSAVVSGHGEAGTGRGIDSMTRPTLRNTLELFVIEPSARPAVRARMGTLRKQLDDCSSAWSLCSRKRRRAGTVSGMRTRRLAYVAAFTAAAEC